MKQPSARRRAAETAGRQAEESAARFLQDQHYEILATRLRTPLGEIDLIAARPGLTIFVEVKQRRARDDALMAVTQRQARRIVQAAHYWLARNPERLTGDCRFDIILMSPYLLPEHIENAFGADI